MDTDFGDSFDGEERAPDPREEDAREALEAFFDANQEAVFFSRQLEVRHEDTWYHWITNRALRDLIQARVLKDETRSLATGGTVHLMWHRSHRYYRRDATKVVRLVEEYANPNVGGAVGLHGEHMVLEGFARRQFVMRGRNASVYGTRVWESTAHDFDFIFERDSVSYGVEVKNTLGYMAYDEWKVKMQICAFLRIKPVFAARMLPKSWINEIIQGGGYAMILKYQLYPIAHRELAPFVSLSHRRITLTVRPGSSRSKRAALQRMKTKWGSCNHRARTIRLNTELVKKPRDLLEYVVVHEMLHLIESTHTERFLTLMKKHYPAWREARAELNELSAETWRL
ncbi:MAG: putative metal-dependent hydrolase [Burkholderiales bacterium]|nr:putative metal-dependent hydrolase [Burkholderiales bacterium]